jgi:transposase InsO family protein
LLLERLPQDDKQPAQFAGVSQSVKDMTLTGSNQAWAGDIASIRTDAGFLYLSLIMDLWSRKIVGYHVSQV